MKQRAAVETTGCTARQLDYWTRQGYIVPMKKGDGSGRWHDYGEDALVTAYALRWLVDTMANPRLVHEALQIRPDAKYLLYFRTEVDHGGAMLLQESLGTMMSPEVDPDILDQAKYITIVPLDPIRKRLEKS